MPKSYDFSYTFCKISRKMSRRHWPTPPLYRILLKLLEQSLKILCQEKLQFRRCNNGHNGQKLDDQFKFQKKSMLLIIQNGPIPKNRWLKPKVETSDLGLVTLGSKLGHFLTIWEGSLCKFSRVWLVGYAWYCRF